MRWRLYELLLLLILMLLLLLLMLLMLLRLGVGCHLKVRMSLMVPLLYLLYVLIGYANSRLNSNRLLLWNPLTIYNMTTLLFFNLFIHVHMEVRLSLFQKITLLTNILP